MAYKILFIDEESSQFDAFLDYFEKVSPENNPQCMFPAPTIDEMVEQIEEYKPDALVTDFRLNEMKVDITYTVKYNGVELIKRIREQREGFPCFVITSFDDDAVNDSDDVNLVYIKDILRQSEDKAKVTFAQRVTSQIEKYQSQLSNASSELSSLIAKRNNGQATVYDENKIIELDSFLEKSLGAYDAIPKHLKELSNLERLKKLIDRVDELIKIVE